MNRQEELLMEEGEEVRDGRAEGPSAIGDAGKAAVPLTHDIDGIGSGFWPEPDVCLDLQKFST